MATYNYSGFGDLVSGLELALTSSDGETEPELKGLEQSIASAEDAEASIKDG